MPAQAAGRIDHAFMITHRGRNATGITRKRDDGQNRVERIKRMQRFDPGQGEGWSLRSSFFGEIAIGFLSLAPARRLGKGYGS